MCVCLLNFGKIDSNSGFDSAVASRSWLGKRPVSVLHPGSGPSIGQVISIAIEPGWERRIELERRIGSEIARFWRLVSTFLHGEGIRIALNGWVQIAVPNHSMMGPGLTSPPP